jgi:hypothetical protein
LYIAVHKLLAAMAEEVKETRPCETIKLTYGEKLSALYILRKTADELRPYAKRVDVVVVDAVDIEDAKGAVVNTLPGIQFSHQKDKQNVYVALVVNSHPHGLHARCMLTRLLRGGYADADAAGYVVETFQLDVDGGCAKDCFRKQMESIEGLLETVYINRGGV